jgi:hypothetical protein
MFASPRRCASVIVTSFSLGISATRPATAANTAARAVRLGILATLGFALFGVVARYQIMIDGLARPLAANIFFRLYALYELPFLLLLLGTVVVGSLMMIRRAPEPTQRTPIHQLVAPGETAVGVTALVVLVVTVLVTYLVLHGYAFSMDEFSADFQARLFARGQYEAALPGPWRPLAGGITPIFVGYDAAHGTWISQYLPGYALLKAPFVAIGAPTLLNPLLAALTIVALAAVARRCWPDEGLRPWLAIALLATLSQFVITSGTAYSMPAHLCANLVWLWLYLRGDDRSWLAALVVGVIALGLHNPFPHALFVAPFLIRLVRDRRWRRVGSAALFYGAGSIGWFLWLRALQSLGPVGDGLLSVLQVPGRAELWLNAINVSLLFTWQTPVFGMLVVAALVQARRLTPPMRDLAWGVLLTIVFYAFFPATQGHGWGYRYAYQVLGSLALLGAAGITPLVDALGSRRASLLVGASLIVGLVAQLPHRLMDTERFVRPFAAAADYVLTRPADVVLVNGSTVWYGRDLVRNDPFLEGQPIVVRSDGLTSAGRAYLERLYPGRVQDVTDEQLLKLGMTPWQQHLR